MDQERFGQFYQSKVWRSEQHPYLIKQLLSRSGLQRTYTPVELCTEIIGKLSGYANLANSQILVLFNLEFVDTLIRVFRVNPANITYFADSELEARAARKWYNVECPTELIVWDTENKKIIMPNIKKQFDVVVMNPPYQPPGQKTIGKSIWSDFVVLGHSLLRNEGFLCSVHPAKWRSPNDKLHDLMFVQNNMIALSIHNKQEGGRIFGAITRYDWYVLQKTKNKGKSLIQFEGHKNWTQIDMRQFSFLPNFAFDIWLICLKMSSQLGRMEVVRDQTFNLAAKPNSVSKEQGNEYPFPLIHSINGQDGIRTYWSKEPHSVQNERKVVFSNGEFVYPYYDDGQYGVCDHALYTKVINKKNGIKVVNFLNSQLFRTLVASTKWSNFETNRHIFASIPDVTLLPGLPDNPTDADFFKTFGLSSSQQSFCMTFGPKGKINSKNEETEEEE